jgi:hypothetical protein
VLWRADLPAKAATPLRAPPSRWHDDRAAAALPFFPQRIPIEIKVGPKPRGYRDNDGIGYRRGDVGTHTSRTIMHAELTALFAVVPATASGEDITTAIRYANCLSKSTTSTRQLTHQRLSELYALDPHVPNNRVLRRLWSLEPYDIFHD